MGKKVLWDGEPVPPEKWARDHYSTIAYAFTRAGTHLDLRHLRLKMMQPAAIGTLVGYGSDAGSNVRLDTPNRREYPTRLKNGVELAGHDDIDCLDDAMAVGILDFCGTRINPMVSFTHKGLILGQWLRQQIDKGSINTMELTWEEASRESGCGLDLSSEE